MCGITGLFSFQSNTKAWFDSLEQANNSLQKRGPDAGAIWQNEIAGLGHRRLSIIDTSQSANQPMFDETKQYVIVFNGEIFNYRELKNELIKKGIRFRTNSDTEVILELYKTEQENFFNKLNGFFAFAIYDIAKKKIVVARDRYGIKPLYYFKDENVMAFASELKAMNCFPIKKEIDPVSLSFYFQLNYIPQPNTIFKNIRQLMPGNYIVIDENNFEEKNYYKIPFKNSSETVTTSYDAACNQFGNLLEESVKRRMISDVPLGAFLSGGIDSSVIVALASRFTNKLKTFSIGFRDEPFFDETRYANLVAEKFNTEHTVFSLTTIDLYDELFNVLDYLDEPFADSSALAVFILSKQTRKHVTVALSGDGADELFGGYMKHVGEYKIRHAAGFEKMIGSLDFLWKSLPQSRNTKISNNIRRLHKIAEGLSMNMKDRYWRFASIGSAEYVSNLLANNWKSENTMLNNKREQWLNYLNNENDMNESLLADMQLVLPNDMLVKVDRMSMANSLEVRTPFLDFEVVDFAFSLPADFKIKNSDRKKIIQDTFRKILPSELYKRPKQGFEVPLLKWFRGDLKNYIDELTSEKFIEAQNIFNISAIKKLKQTLQSNNPGDATAKMWAIIVFQHWWKKYMPN